MHYGSLLSRNSVRPEYPADNWKAIGSNPIGTTKIIQIIENKDSKPW